MFGGGVADKFGNIYEALWAVRQLLAVFRAEAHSIRLEGISAAFRGFEFAVDHGDYPALRTRRRMFALKPEIRCEDANSSTKSRLPSLAPVVDIVGIAWLAVLGPAC